MPRASFRPLIGARRRLVGVTLIAALSAIAPAATSTAANAGSDVVQRPDLEREFAQAGTVGTMVVQQHGRIDRTVIVGDRRSRQRIQPSSTFKIPNALIAIDAGVASGPDHAYPGPNPNYLLDGQPLLPIACEGDLTLRTAFQNSCIPIFQQLARKIGSKAYRKAVRAFDYGNERVMSAPVDDFWLHGPFAISAREQVAFLERLRVGRLPVTSEARHAVRDMLVTERRDGWTLRGKTGFVFAQDGQPQRGWWVGSVERRGQVSTFALNIDMARPDLYPARVAIGTRILEQLGAF